MLTVKSLKGDTPHRPIAMFGNINDKRCYWTNSVKMYSAGLFQWPFIICFLSQTWHSQTEGGKEGRGGVPDLGKFPSFSRFFPLLMSLIGSDMPSALGLVLFDFMGGGFSDPIVVRPVGCQTDGIWGKNMNWILPPCSNAVAHCCAIFLMVSKWATKKYQYQYQRDHLVGE